MPARSASAPASRNLPAVPHAPQRLFASLTPAHQGRARVRYRYRLTPGLPTLAPHALERMAQEIPDVSHVRLNTAARSIALHYEPGRTGPEAIAQACTISIVRI